MNVSAGTAGEDRAVSWSFEQFVDTHYGGVLALVVAVYGSRDPEDIVQEAFARAQQHWDDLADTDRPDRWVRRVALNLAVSRYRRWRAEVGAITRLAGRREEPATLRFSTETTAVWDQVRGLPTRQAQVIALRYVDDLAVTDIAAILGIAEGTVRALLHQARHRLAAALGESLGSEREDQEA